MTARPGGVGELCPHAQRCPGCPWIKAPYSRSLEAKALEVERAFSGYPELRLERGPVRGAPTVTAYRVRAKLVADGGRLGLFAAGSHDVVDIPGCPVLAPELEAAAAALRASLPLEMPLGAVDLRLCDSGVLLCLIAVGRPPRELIERSCERVLAQVPNVAGLAVSFRDPASARVLGTEPEVIAGNAEEPHHLSADAPWHYASHGAFTQAHPEQTTRLYSEIERALEARWEGLRGVRVLELYAGSGALGMQLSARGADVTLVEGFAPAAERIERAARAQGLKLEARALSAEAFLESPAAGVPERFDAVLVNPPRRGLSPAVRAGVAKLRPRLVSYVSCNPQSLARDLSHLALLGLAGDELTAFDMIPLSDAVECWVLLESQPPPAPRVLFEDHRALALYKPPFESTTPQGESESSLLARARATLGIPELTPVHRLDATTSGVCWFARRPENVAELAAGLARGDKTYVALAHGVTREKGKIDRDLLESGRRRAAVTRYRRQRVLGGHSLLQLFPEHGRKHQLRRHLASIGHPILGDVRYGRAAGNRHFEHRHGLDRTFLHCERSVLELDSGRLEARADLAADLAAVIKSLEAEQR